MRERQTDGGERETSKLRQASDRVERSPSEEETEDSRGKTSSIASYWYFLTLKGALNGRSMQMR